MRRLLMATLTMALMAGTAYAMPGPGMGGPGAHSGEGLLRALIALDLTDAQKHEAALILSKYREEGKERRDAFRKAMEGVREASEAAPFDEGAIRAACKRAAAAGEEMAG
jgi:protein CpxP